MLKQVLRLTRKDFQLQAKSILGYILTAVFLGTVFSLLGMTNKEFVYALVTYTIIYSFVNKALYEDERNNTLRLLVSMPVERNAIVYARYLSTGALIVGVCIVMFLMQLFFSVVLHQTVEAEGVVAFFSILLFFTIMISIYLPLAFKLGYIKAAGINRFVFFGLFAFIGAASFVVSGAMKGREMPDSIRNLDAALTSMNVPALLGILVAILVVVLLLSMWISVKVFSKRVLY